MPFGQRGETPGLRLLFTLAVMVVLVYGLRFAQPIVMPFAVAGFLAVISLPIVPWLSKRRIPTPVGIPLTVLAVASVFGLVILLASQQLAELQALGPAYGRALFSQVENSFLRLAQEWLPGELQPAVETVPTSALGVLNDYLLAVAGGTFTRALSFVTTTFLVFLILAFALSEAAVFPAKLRAVAGDRLASDGRLGKVVGEVQGYLVIKTLVSLATGLLLGLWTWAMGLDSPLLLGLVAFVLNYVPTIGSVIASVPALVLAFVDFDAAGSAVAGFDLQRTVVVGLGYLTVNIVFGNWLEPTLMGRRLGLSTLVVVLSLVFWGWLWGPVGALLSVPLTMVVKIMAENTKDLRWVAVLLDKDPPATEQAAAPEQAGTGQVPPEQPLPGAAAPEPT